MTEVNEVNLSQKRGTMADGEGGGGGIVKLIIIILVVVIILVGGGIGAFMFLGDGENDEASIAQAARSVGAGGGCDDASLGYLPLGTFVVNLSDGRRYLKTNIELMLCDEKIEDLTLFLNKRLVEIKDLVVSELQSLSTEQLRDQRERELVRQRLLRRIESLLPNKDVPWEDPNPIKKVLITEFYLQ